MSNPKKAKTEAVRYPWDKWFKPKQKVLLKGVDYACQTHSMIAMIRNVARSRGVGVSIRADDGGIVMQPKPKGK